MRGLVSLQKIGDPRSSCNFLERTIAKRSRGVSVYEYGLVPFLPYVLRSSYQILTSIFTRRVTGVAHLGDAYVPTCNHVRCLQAIVLCIDLLLNWIQKKM